ncbi:unnamed protein product [Mycena citricolor]|uniref:Uncharacterized protein n=1 Tax=Mycena citricolor TaxID=2018698 RepID=A0AAD2HM36_9AGAR|nr:unnamed protein product [Mycena citricolor]
MHMLLPIRSVCLALSLMAYFLTVAAAPAPGLTFRVEQIRAGETFADVAVLVSRHSLLFHHIAYNDLFVPCRTSRAGLSPDVGSITVSDHRSNKEDLSISLDPTFPLNDFCNLLQSLSSLVRLCTYECIS